MHSWIASPRDFWTGIIYITIGAGAAFLASGYSFGTVRKMGPGLFPTVLALCLIAIGALSLIRSLVVTGEPISRIAWKPLILVCGAIVIYGLLVMQAGLPVALTALILTGAMASRSFRFDPLALAGMAGLVGFAAAVFVKGLGLPIPLVGPALKSLLAAAGIVI